MCPIFKTAKKETSLLQKQETPPLNVDTPLGAKTSVDNGEKTAESSNEESGHKDRSCPAGSEIAVKCAKPAKEVEAAESLELSPTEMLVVSGHCLEFQRKKSPNLYKLVFDDYIYIQFIRCLRDLCLYISMPNSRQYEAMVKFAQKAQDMKITRRDLLKSSSTKLDMVLRYAYNYPDQTEGEKFFLRQFLILNLPLLYAHSQLNELIGENISSEDP